MIPPVRDECIEQAYFFRILRERVEANLAAQDVMMGLSEELLSTTRLPMAVQFVASELKHSGSMANGFDKIPHYFTPFQRFVIRQTEDDKRKLTFSTSMLLLEREARYKADEMTPAGLFVFQFECLTRNKLGYEDGLTAMSLEPTQSKEWQANASMFRKQIGIVEFSELVYLRSEYYVADQKRIDPDFVPSLLPLFGEKEGKIAKASLGRDQLFLFSALQRQLNYPEVPQPKPKDDPGILVQQLEAKLRDLDIRVRMMEAESRGNFDPTQFGKPEMFRDLPDDDQT